MQKYCFINYFIFHLGELSEPTLYRQKRPYSVSAVKPAILSIFYQCFNCFCIENIPIFQKTVMNSLPDHLIHFEADPFPDWCPKSGFFPLHNFPGKIFFSYFFEYIFGLLSMHFQMRRWRDPAGETLHN